MNRIEYGIDKMSYSWHLIPSLIIEIVKFEPKFERKLAFVLLFLNYSLYLEITISK